MIVAASVPCTQASAAVWTRRAGGNDTVAVLTTMATSLACFVVTPAWLELLAGRTGGAGQDFGQLVVRLALVVALPIIAGQLLRAMRDRASLGGAAGAGPGAICAAWHSLDGVRRRRRVRAAARQA